ncbi:MAG: hypothetical protein WD872_17970, partial [Pirellulaceae bacterium]
KVQSSKFKVQSSKFKVQSLKSEIPMLAAVSRFVLPPLVVVAALLAYRLTIAVAGSESAGQRRTEPLLVAPRYDEPRVITDEQLAAVLDRVKPPTGPPTTNNLIHALRLWGAKADFQDAAIPTGREMQAYFLDDRVFRRFAGERALPIFYRDPTGISARSYDEGPADRETSSHHADDLLATLAEVGTPLDASLHLRDGRANVAELLDSSLGRLHLARFEYEWAMIAYARYVFPQTSFRNRWGERIDVEQLIDEAIGPPLALGPCNGLHRLEALAVLYRADERAQVLGPRTKRKMLAHMQRVSDLLVQSQTVSGYWTRHWPQGAAAANQHGGDRYDQILVTGHQLEWLALAPEEVQPPRENIVRAGQWLTHALLEMDRRELLAAYGPYTHAARGLALWRNQQPYEAWLTSRPTQVSLNHP